MSKRESQLYSSRRIARIQVHGPGGGERFKMNNAAVAFCWIFCWALLKCFGQTDANYHCGIRKHSFVQLVHHGWKVEDGQWPWHVAIFHKAANGTVAYACGGSLIDRQYVLTAAHCVVNRPSNTPMSGGSLELRFGLKDLYKMEKHVQIRDAGMIHVHPDYTTHRNDIAVVELRLPVEFTDFVIPICLDTRVDKDLRNLEGQRGWITGWGSTQNGSLLSELRSASLPVVSYLQCFQDDRTLFGSILSPTVYCAGDRNGTSPGTGDSGGGMYFSEGDRWVLRGIVSFAKIDESRLKVDASKYAVFVNVQRFLSWIREVTEDYEMKSAEAGATKRISERECDRFKTLVRKRANGICSNSRYPHSVSLVYPDGKERCNGILLNENHVLTACHCRNYVYYASEVRIGEYGTINISSFTCHPGYDGSRMYHDLAVVRLNSSIDLSVNMVPACLASNWTENLYDTLLTTGFSQSEGGVTYFIESDANQVVPQDECSKQLSTYKKRLPEGILPAQLCVINNDSVPSTSWGSAGSPLQTVNTRTCVFTVVGVLNFGSSSAMMDFFSRVAYYLDWIEEIAWGTPVIPQTTMRAWVEPITREAVSLNDFVFPVN